MAPTIVQLPGMIPKLLSFDDSIQGTFTLRLFTGVINSQASLWDLTFRPRDEFSSSALL
jgi:hypothetical protein